jgi:carboxymethylenebutenolidase
MADEFAAQGYIAVLPDLLSGTGPNGGGTEAYSSQDQVTRAVSGLNATQVNSDLSAAADYAKKLPAANGKLYVAGFCWGGGKSFDIATHRKDLSAAFVFYGTPPPADAMANISAPVYGFYAGNDARISATVPQTKADMAAAHKQYEAVIYDGAGHGFMRAGEQPDATPANKAARDQAFAKVLAIMKSSR